MKRGTLFSDHHPITYSVDIRSNTANHKTNVIVYRKNKTIDNKVFADHISTSLSDVHLLELKFGESAELYDKILTDALDAVASLNVRRLVIDYPGPLKG